MPHTYIRSVDGGREYFFDETNHVWYDAETGEIIGHGYRRQRPRRAAPPKPRPRPKPTPEEIEANFSSWVKLEKHYSGIRLQSIDDVLAAVAVFAKGPAAALAENTNQIGDAYGGMAAGTFMLANLYGRSDTFLKNLLAEIKAKLTSGDGFVGSWDYDGPGPFHKASLNVDRLSDGAFRLSIYAAYVGAQPEHRLGETLIGIHERNGRLFSAAPLVGLPSVKIQMRFATRKGSDRFAIPIRKILADIDDRLSDFNIDGAGRRASDEDILAMLVPKDRYDPSGTPLTVMKGESIKVLADITQYRIEPDYVLRNQPDRDAECRIEDGILSGPSRRDERFDLFESVEIEVAVIAADRNYCFDTAIKDQIGDLAAGLYEALKKYGSKKKKTHGGE